MNNTNNESSFGIEMPYAMIPFYTAILVWSLVGNILVIVVIFKNSCLKTNFNFLIVNMAASDLFIPCLALPMKIADAKLRQFEWLVDGEIGTFLCKMCYFFADISTAVSAFSLVIIAVNRYIAIAFPMQGRLSKTKTLRLIAGTWILAAILLSPYLYTFRLEHGHGWTMCFSHWSDATAHTVFILIVIVFVFVIPCLATTALYPLMLCKLRQNSNNMVYMLNDQQYKRRQRKDKNIFIMTIVIIFLYVLLWGPFFCLVIVLSFVLPKNTENGHSIQTAVVIVQFLGYLNSAVNPCIYFYFLRNLRQGARKLFLHDSSQKNMKVSSFKMTTIRSRVSASIRSRHSKTSSEV